MKAKMSLVCVMLFAVTAFAGPYKSSTYEGNKALLKRETSYVLPFQKASEKLRHQIHAEKLKRVLIRMQKQNAEMMKKLNLTEAELAQLMQAGINSEMAKKPTSVREGMEQHLEGLRKELERVKKENEQGRP